MLRSARSWSPQRAWLALIAGVLGMVAAYWIVAPKSQLRIIQSLEMDRARSPLGGGLVLFFPDKVNCSGFCVQALASGRYQVVTRTSSTFQQRTLRVNGACGQDIDFLFLAHGYVGMCADADTVVVPDNAIVVREFRFDHGTVAAITGTATVLRAMNKDSVPVESGPVKEIATHIPGFVGMMYEVSLRRDGQEKIVGRRFSGHLSTSSNADAGQDNSAPVRAGFEPAVFYAHILGLPPAHGSRSGPTSLATIFDILEARLDAASPVDKTGGVRELPLAATFSTVAANARPEESALVHERIERYIAKDRPIFVHAVLNTLYFQHAEPSEIKSVLLRFLDSRNPDVVSVALRKSDYQFEMRGDPDILQHVHAIPFRAELFERETELTATGPSYALIDNDFDPAARQAAERILLSATDMVPGYCRILLSIVAGDPDTPNAATRALDDFLATAPAVFTACSNIVDELQRRFRAGPLTDEQIARLDSRFDLVPMDRQLSLASRFLKSEHARAITNDRFLSVIRNLAEAAERDGKTREAQQYRNILDLLSRP